MNLLEAAARNHRPDFNLILVVKQLILGHQFIAADHKVRLDDKIEFSQDVFGPLGAFDFYVPRGVTELHVHGSDDTARQS